jgi:hypothetical protein
MGTVRRCEDEIAILRNCEERVTRTLTRGGRGRWKVKGRRWKVEGCGIGIRNWGLGVHIHD